MNIVNPFGFVAGRWAFATADTAGDPDRGPDYVPASGASITFTPETPRQVVPDSPGWTGVINKRVVGKLNEEGRLVDAEGHNHFALGVGTYAVHYYFGNGIKWPSHRIQVTEAHTASNPLWLPPMPAPPDVPGAVNRTIQVPADGADGQVLVWDGGGFSWEFPPKGDKGDPGDPGTSDIVVDTTVGTRVFANGIMVYGNTGWRDVQDLLEPGWEPDRQLGYFHIRRTNDTLEMTTRLRVTPDAEFIGTSRSIRQRIIVLPYGFRVFTTYVPLATPMLGGEPIVIEGDGPANITVARGAGTWAAGDLLQLTMSTPSQAIWPGTLPGNPV